MTSPRSLPTDVVAGRYALCDPLDSGGSGTVWRAWDLARGRYCAAKLLRRREAGQLLRFVREQQVRLTGAHVASPYAWAAEEADVLIATELVDGGSLHALVGRTGALAEPTVAVLLDQLLQALETVHAAGLVHRDVKPGNVLLRATGHGSLDVQLIDFGLAIRSEDARLTELGMVIGTPGYLPPELADAGVGPTPAQDLFAAGRTAAAVLQAIEPTLGVPQTFQIEDPVLRDVLTGLLQRDPALRPADASVARAMLAAARSDPHPRRADGMLVDIGSRLPALPPGWDAVHGPGVDARLASAHEVALHRPRGGTVIDTGIDAGIALPSRAPVAPSRSTPGPRLESRTRPPGRWPWLVGGVGALLAVAAIVAAVVVRSNPNPPNSDPLPPGRSGVTGSGTQSAAGRASIGPSTGTACDWTREGDVVSGPTGAVTCTLSADGQYSWVAA